MKKTGSILTLIVCILAFFISDAQTTFTAKAPSTVGVNEGFTLSYTINSDKVSHFQQPSVTGAKIVAGPYQSRSSSTTIINGKMSSSSSVTMSFTLVASKEGTVNITPAKIESEGRIYTSNAVAVKVVNNPTMAQRGYNQGQQRQNSYNPYNRQQQQYTHQYSRQNNAGDASAEDKINDDMMFVRAIPSKQNVVKGEEIVITYRLYTRLRVTQYQIEKIPSSSGFWTEELDAQANPTLHLETYNGRQYQVADLKKVILYPQKSGILTIKPMALTVTAVITSRSRQQFSTGDPFFDQFLNDPFFSTFSTSYKNVEKKLYTNSITFNVKDLPKKPDNYCGGVGTFSLASDISTQHTKAFESFYLTYMLSGNGNLTLINNLPLDLPDEFQISDPEITDNITRTANGLSGTRTFRYLVIPRVEGKFTIPALTLSYYNINKGGYDSISVDSYQMQIDKGDVSEDFALQLDQRAKYRNMNIKSNLRFTAMAKEYHIFDYWITYLWPFVFILLLAINIAIYSRYKKLSADIVTVKMKKSTKIAVKRLKKAKKFLDKGQTEAFEDETATALWNYLEDRFKMNRTDLSIQGCKDELISINVDNTTVEKLGTILERCQYLRFSQDKEATADLTLYNDAIDVISSIEEQMKNLKKMKKQQNKKPEHEIHIPTGLSLLTVLLISTVTFNIANAVNTKQIEVSAEQCCKTADSCFKASDYAEAMLYYEKALKLSPADKNIQLNINITRSRLVGDTYIMPKFVLVRWTEHLSGLLPLPVWLIMFLGCFALSCVCFFFYLFNENKKVLLFYITIFTFTVSLCAMGLGIVRQNIMNDNTHAILMKSNIHLRQTKNDNAKDVAIMYKGQKIKILEDDGSKWIKVRTEDNKTGYMENKNFKRI